MEKGELLVSGSVDEIVGKIKISRTIRFKAASGVDTIVPALLERFDVTNARQLEDNIIEFEFSGTEEEIATIHEYVVSQGIKLSHFAEIPLDLEDVFFHITRGAVQ
jgi:ABC-2 type transport system ATP-binding protein